MTTDATECLTRLHVGRAAHRLHCHAVPVQRLEKQGYSLDIGNLETHMTMNRSTWSGIADTSNRSMGELYFRSALLVYFFNHLDGEKDREGQRFIRFMDAVYGEVAALRAFFADPRVKTFPDGRFSYPSDFPPPAAPHRRGGRAGPCRPWLRAGPLHGGGAAGRVASRILADAV